MNGFVSRIRQTASKRAAYRKIVDELSMLSARDLNDIGIAYGSIREIARTAVYGQ